MSKTELVKKSKSTEIISLSTSSESENDVVLISDEEMNENNADGSNIKLNVVHSNADDDDCQVSDVNTGVVVKWKKVVSPNIWTNGMRRYYNKPCKRQKHFDWKKELAAIRSGPPSSWDILDSDLYPVRIPQKRCTICRQVDHLFRNCPKRNGICNMCGYTGHVYSRCPRSLCLNCGVRKTMFLNKCKDCTSWRNIRCNSCEKFGHETKNCPDIWRRFHSTIDFQDLQSSEPTLNGNIQCCNCAQSGHLYEDCPEPYRSSYLPANSFVSNYDDAIFESISVNETNRPEKKNQFKRSHSFTVDGVDGSDDDEVIERKFMRYRDNLRIPNYNQRWSHPQDSSNPVYFPRGRNRPKKNRSKKSKRDQMKARFSQENNN